MKQIYSRCLSALLLCLLTITAYAQKNISGTVKDATGTPIPAVSVLVKGTKTGVSTDAAGRYAISAAEGSTLVFSYIGYKSQEATVGAAASINIVLQEQDNSLNEVVVTSLGIKREAKSLGYAVSTVTAKEITQAGNTNFGSALYGKAAGVKVTTAPGGASSAVNIQIRGINSLSFNRQPLYVVDGVVIRNDQQNGPGGANNNGGLGSAGGQGIWNNDRVSGNGMLDINPADIETFTVLKGASASALYGSDAASGVIVITTKKGSKGRGLGVDFNYTGSIENAAFLPKMQNIYGPGYDAKTSTDNGGDAESWLPDPNAPGGKRPWWSAYAQFGPKYDGQDVKWWDGVIRPYTAQENNYAEVFDKGFNSNINIGISNQTDKLNYRFSATRMDYKGVTPGSKQQRNTFGLNTSIKMADNLTADIVVNYMNTRTHNRAGLMGNVLASNGGFFNRAEDMDMLKSIYQTSQGYKYSKLGTNRPEAFIYNTNAAGILDYFWSQYKNTYDETENRLLSSATLTYNIVPKLKLRGRIGNDYTSLGIEDKRYNEYALAYNSGGISTGSYSTTKGNYSITYGDALLTYTDKITSDIDFSLTGGFQSRSENYNDQYAGTKDGLISENWFALSNSVGTIDNGLDVNVPRTKRQTLLKYAYLGIANISYKDYLFLEATGRTEYSSTLPPQNNNYQYMSLNSGFIFSQAFKMPEPISFGKLRASYGIVGNDAPMYKSNIAYSQTPLQTVNGSVPSLTLKSDYGNSSLKPERKYEVELGAEMRFLNNRVGFDVSYYSNHIEDQILSLTTAPSAGANSQLVNVGQISNKGLEISLNGTPVQTENFSWRTRLIFSKNTAKLDYLNGEIPELIFFEADQSSAKISAKPGEALGNIYVLPRKTNGNGAFLISDDGYYTMDTDPAHFKKVGNIMPKAIGGLTNTFTYKNFSLDFTVDYRFGGQLVSPALKYGTAAGLYESTLELRDKGITLPGVNENTGLPNTVNLDGEAYYLNTFQWGNLGLNEEGMVYDNSFIKMREAVIGYTVDNKFAKKIGMNNLRFSLIGRNLFYFWKTIENLDPEAPVGNQWYSQGVDFGSTAATRSFGISLNANF